MRSVLLGAALWVAACSTRLGVEAPVPYGEGAGSRRVNVVSWNVAKGRLGGVAAVREEIVRILREERADVACLQEANLALLPRGTGLGAHFAPGWAPAGAVPWPIFGGRASGVATMARAAPRRVVHLRSEDREVGVFTPKVSLLTTHPVLDAAGRVHHLLVANVHALNFTPPAPVERQMTVIVARLARHRGPVVLCGDFNTWNAERLRRLRERLAPLGLVEVAFPEGRTTAPVPLLGDTPLDHVFVRGLRSLARGPGGGPAGVVVPGDWSSDHRPIAVRLRCCTGDGLQRVRGGEMSPVRPGKDVARPVRTATRGGPP